LEYKCKRGYTIDGSKQGQTSWAQMCQADGTHTGGYQCVPVLYSVHGGMKNAVNNAPISHGKATLKYLDDSGNPISGELKDEGNGVGIFHLEGVKQGKVLVKYSAPGYIDGEQKLDIENNVQAGTVADLAMSPVMSKDSWRAILSWGKKPRDMDTHLYWANNPGCHVYYARRRVNCGDGIIGILDVDDVSSYGPETLTFKNVGKDYNSKINSMGPEMAPIVTYKIHNYSRRPTMASRDDIVVKLYNGERMVQEFKIGQDGTTSGNFWTVFSLNAYTGEVIPDPR